MSNPSELLQLIHNDIPEGRRHLADSHVNLEKVAAYCEGNYLQAPEKRQALEETKNYTTQSLASVAYQINTLATNFLSLLDLQMNQLSEMESSVNHLSQTVCVHKEKVARREIGVLTTNKSTTRPQGVKNPGIIFPNEPERPVKYVRKPIDYSALDDIGHGVKGQNRARRTSSGRQPNATSGSGQASKTRPPTPPQQQPNNVARTGTLTRQNSSPYRPAPPVSPPNPPHSNYAPNYPRAAAQSEEMDIPPPPPTLPTPPMATSPLPPPPDELADGLEETLSDINQFIYEFGDDEEDEAERRSGYAPGRIHRMAAPPPAPPTGMVYPMTHQQQPQQQAVAMNQQQVMSQQMMNHMTQQQLHQSHSMHQPPSPSPPPPPLPQESELPPPPPVSDVTHGGRETDLPPPMIHAYDPAGPMPPPAFVLGAPSGGGGISGHYGRMADMRAAPGSAPRPGRQFSHEDDPHDLPPDPQQAMMDHAHHNGMPPQFIEKVVAIYDYQKDKADELSFSEGSVIYVVKKNDDGWWEGVLDGVTGLFPGNYVEPCM